MIFLKKIYIIFFTIIIITISFVISTKETNGKGNTILADNGLYTIIEFDPDKQMALNGEWEFYFNRLYNSEDFQGNTIKEKPNYVKVPSDWNYYDLQNQKITRKGYATYRLLIKLPETEVGTIKTLYMPSVSSAHTLWIDGEKMASRGIVSTSKKTMKPETAPMFIQFQPQSETVELVIQASNFHQRKSGIYDAILLGEPDVIHQHQEQKNLYRAIVVASLIIMGLYHFALFALRKNEFSLLFFGGFCVAVAIRATIIEEGLALNLLSFLNWDISNKLEYLGATIGTLFFTLFSFTQFPLDFNKKIRNLIAITFILYSLFIITSSVMVFTMTMVPLQFIIIFTLIYIMFVFLLALQRKRPGSLLNVLATIILVSVALNDIFFFNQLVDTMEMTSIGLVFFLLTQSFNLSKKYSKSYQKIEKLSNDLKSFNESLEKEVADRTAELNDSNKQLHAANEIRRRLLTNISHELGTPLTSIQGYTKAMADGVIPSEKKYLQLVYEKVVYLSKILNDLHAITEIETRQIQFDKEKIIIQQYCDQLYEKHKIDFDKTTINYTYINELKNENDYFVYIDPIRIEQVIVNFMTNAIKFTPLVDGRITFKLSLADNEHIMFEVIDNGCGIDDHAVKHVFERFYKSYAMDNQHKGAGLGLAISKEIIEFHNGKIGVRSKVGEGSCFYFMLPIVQKD